ncbi:MAG: zinc ribbon domain-containing protein [Chitinophagales bacterium]
MAATKTKELTIKESLQALFNLQKIHSKIDQINILKGELPMEVSDLEDEIAGLDTRHKKLEGELKEIETDVANRKAATSEAKSHIKKYEQQQNNVKNSREFDALTKEIELNKLDIELNEKKVKEAKVGQEAKTLAIEQAKKDLDVKKKELKKKKEELTRIIDETEKEEAELDKKATKAEKDLDSRLLHSYNRIRTSYRNGLAVVAVQRNSCGGCFSTVPPQRQAEIKQAKKIVICEHCGRILVDAEALA